MSRGILDTIHSEAMRVVRLTATNIQKRQRVAEDKANNLMSNVQDIYRSDGNADFSKAEPKLIGIVTYHRAKEQATESKLLEDKSSMRPTD